MTTSLNDTVITIDKPITAATIVFPDTEPDSAAEVTDNWTKRPRTLTGMTYRSQHPDRRYRVYVTINHNFDQLNNQWRPYELFISPSEASSYQWLSYISRRDTRMLRNREDVLILINEMKETFDTGASGYLSQGKFIPSVIAEIGFILEEHVNWLQTLSQNTNQNDVKLLAHTQTKDNTTLPGNVNEDKACPKCLSRRWIRQDNCDTCAVCGHSKCGD